MAGPTETRKPRWQAMSTSKIRKKSPDRSKQARHNRKLYLPMERAAANDIMLHCRLALETIRQGRGDKENAYCIAQAVLLTRHLTLAGYGRLDSTHLENVEHELWALLDHGRDTGNWVFADSVIEDLTTVVNEYDRLLRETRLQAVVDASEWLDRVIAKKQTTAK